MKSSLALILNSLNLPALSNGDMAALKSIQRDWNQHSARMSLLVPERVLADQKTAFTAFLADPTEEHEQRLAVLADERLTAKRYGLLHKAHAELRRRISQKAAGIVRPVLESMQQTLQLELDAREESAQAAGLSKRTDELCVAIREALDQVALGLTMMDEVINISSLEDRSPFDLASMLLPTDSAQLA